MRAEGLELLGEPGRIVDLGWNPKEHIYQNIAQLGGIDRMEGSEEMSTRRMP